jgi:hypothetical protein
MDRCEPCHQSMPQLVPPMRFKLLQLYFLLLFLFLRGFSPLIPSNKHLTILEKGIGLNGSLLPMLPDQAEPATVGCGKVSARFGEA